MVFGPGSRDGVQCWVAAGDVEIRSQSFTPRRATPTYFHLPRSKDAPQNTYVELVADIREGLEEVFDSLDCRAPFIPGYKDKDDAIARAKLLRSHGRAGLDIILVCLTQCLPEINYRRLDKYAENVSSGCGAECAEGSGLYYLRTIYEGERRRAAQDGPKQD